MSAESYASLGVPAFPTIDHRTSSLSHRDFVLLKREMEPMTKKDAMTPNHVEPSSRRPPSATGVGPLLTDDERVDQAGLGSFPASDPPPWTSGSERRPRRDIGDREDPDGGNVRERARRRRHID